MPGTVPPSPESHPPSQRRRLDSKMDASTAATSACRRTVNAAPTAMTAPPTTRGLPSLSGGQSNGVVRSRSAAIPSTSTTKLRSADHEIEAEESLLDVTSVDETSSGNMSCRATNPDVMTKKQLSGRDSHDLTLPTRQITRDSLVANMLLSLDQYSLGQVTPLPTPRSLYDEAPVSRPSATALSREELPATRPNISRPGPLHKQGQGHGSGCDHAQSKGAPVEGIDDAPCKSPSQQTKGIAGPSSPKGTHSRPSRVSSTCETRSRCHDMRSRGRESSTRSRSGSSSSSRSSVEVGTGLNGQPGEFRCTSPDYGQRPALDPCSSHGSVAAHGEFNDAYTAYMDEDYEAAPTPTVPAGPRRSAIPRGPMQQPTCSPGSGCKAPATKVIQTCFRGGAPGRKRQGKGSNGASNLALLLSSLDNEAGAAGPTVGYGKSQAKQAKQASQSGERQQVPVHTAGSNLAAVSAQTATKHERPGFFRRVFGGASKNPTSLSPASDLDVNPTMSATSVSACGSPETTTVDQGSSSPAPSIPTSLTKAATSTAALPSRDPQSSGTEQPVLQKKPSFFRRRKKTGEPTAPRQASPPPPMPSPAVHGNAKLVDEEEKARCSSLRQAMGPFLKTDTPDTPTLLQKRDGIAAHYDVDKGKGEQRRKSRGFSPGYEPSPSATIRAVKSHSALHSRNGEGETPDTPVPLLHTPGPVDDRQSAPSEKQRSGGETFFEESSEEDAGAAYQVHVRRGKTMRTSRRTSPLARVNIAERPSTSPTVKQDVFEGGLPDLLTKLGSAGKDYQRQRASLAGRRDKAARTGSVDVAIEGSGTKSTRVKDVSTVSDTALPSVTVHDTAPVLGASSPLDKAPVRVGEPTEDDREKAQRIYDGNEDFIQRERAAAWMGEEGRVRQRTLTAYMQLYDFTDKGILPCLRQICDRLILRAETQQIDRILVAFSERWCECNANHGFRAIDVIHTMCYSIMLLNTDLHVADIEHKMTRSQFVKNTTTTIKQVLAEFAPDALDRPSILPGKGPRLDASEPECRESSEPARSMWRTSWMAPPRADSRLGEQAEAGDDNCGPLVKAPFTGSMRDWEEQMEQVLKNIYISIRDEKLPLFGAAAVEEAHGAQQTGALSVMSFLKRSPSVLSKAPSEGAPSRGRVHESGRANAGRFNSKSRSRPRISNGVSSGRASFDEGLSTWSPSTSSATWSKYSLGRTHTAQTSLSVGSHSSAFPHGDFHKSIGFANALSQAIIREDGDGATLGSSRSIVSDSEDVALLDDESLELSGPPWMKEGIVTHKHFSDGLEKKANKDRNWTEVFAVVQKGQMSIFTFASKSTRQKAPKCHGRPGVVGGGNWQENATSLGQFSLRQTLATVTDKGYSKGRPYVWTLVLPNGAVHLFQVGTPEISEEFVSTVNYWSGRLSTHPLVGGISNIEYGWSEACINNALVNAINDKILPADASSASASRARAHSRSNSLQSSLRSSFDVGGISPSSRTKLPGDRIHIADWAPPGQSLRTSKCSESEQLQTLVQYVKGMEAEMVKHQQLHGAMLLAFTARGANHNKAEANWKRKAEYLAQESHKYAVYVAALQMAAHRRAQIYRERDEASRADEDEEKAKQSDRIV